MGKPVNTSYVALGGRRCCHLGYALIMHAHVQPMNQLLHVLITLVLLLS